MPRTFLSLFLFLAAFILPVLSQAGQDPSSLEAFLNKVLNSSNELKAVQLDIRSLRLEIKARDIELSPTLAVNWLRFWDDRPSISSNRQTDGKSVEVALAKPFVTGTEIDLSSLIEASDYTVSNEQNLVNWQLGLTQSLWQNGFGRQTALRRERDGAELKSRLLALLVKQQETLIEFESLYWDLAYSRQEVIIRQENLERSRKILSWIQDRYERSAAEHVDLLQGKTLVSKRELELQVVSDQWKVLQARLKEKIDMETDLVPALEDLKTERSLLTLPAAIDFAPQEPMLIEALQDRYEADSLNAESKYQADQLKPVLEVGYTYGRQGLNPSFSRAREDAFSGGQDYHQIGFFFSVPLDFSLIRASRESTEAAYRAQELRWKNSKRQSSVQWTDLLREIQEQKARIRTALTLAELQNEKSRVERDRFEKGKTTVFQAISFEQEAAESDLLALQLMAQLRRLEAKARLYIAIYEKSYHVKRFVANT